MPQRTPEEKRQYMADWRARKKAIPGSDHGEAEINRHTGHVIDASPMFEPLSPIDTPLLNRMRKRVEKQVDEPVFPKPDNKRGLPRSNYSFLDTPDLIKKMPQKAIDLILERVNIHKGREPK